MKRPCTCDNEYCHLCKLFHTDPRYFKLWGGELSLWGKAVAFVKAAVTHVSTGARRTPLDVYEQRTALCRACEWHTAPDGCLKCGCTNLPLKRSWADQKCPVGKW